MSAMAASGPEKAVLLVLAGEAGDSTLPSVSDLVTLLESWQIPALPAVAAETPALVASGAAEVVVIDRVPDWQRLTTRLEALGAMVILAGAPPGPTEDHHLLAPSLDTAQSPAGLIAAVFRAQGRLRARAEPGKLAHHLLERAQGAELVSRFAQTIAAQLTLPRIVQVAIAKTRDLCDAEGASVLLVDPVTGDLRFDAVDGAGTGRIEHVQLKAGRGVVGKVAATALSLWVPDVRCCPDFDPSTDAQSGFRTGSIIAVPLVLGGDVLGVLEAVRSKENIPFAESHLKRLENLAPHIAVAVHNAQITAELRQAQTEVMSINAGLEQKVAERTQQIGRAKKEWERTFDAIRDPIALQDGFTIRRANVAYAQRVGVPITQVPGKTCHRLWAGRDTPCKGCPLLKGRGEELSGELTFDASSIFRVSGYWMADDPADQSVVLHYQEVTAERLLQEKVRESERLVAIGQLASGAAHEINNPLGFVTSNLTSLRSTLDGLKPAVSAVVKAVGLLEAGRRADALSALGGLEDVDEASLGDGLEMIDESLVGARRVADIVKGLRELSRLEIGKKEPCCVASSVTRAVRAEFAEAPSAVRLELEPSASAEIPPLQLDQALGHILKNARQASTGQPISIRTATSPGQVRIEIRDQGCGIPHENLRRIFEPFFTTRGIGKGIGLGLTAAYGIVKRVGGDIEVVSEVGKGSTFTLLLPLAPAPFTGRKGIQGHASA